MVNGTVRMNDAIGAQENIWGIWATDKVYVDACGPLQWQLGSKSLLEHTAPPPPTYVSN